MADSIACHERFALLRYAMREGCSGLQLRGLRWCFGVVVTGGSSGDVTGGSFATGGAATPAEL